MDKLGVLITQSKENQENEDWLKKVHRKSKSERTRIVANTSLKTFDLFCESIGGKRHPDPSVKYAYIPKMIEQFQKWYNPKPRPDILVRPDIKSICSILDKFVGFMGEDYEYTIYDENGIPQNKTSKIKSSKTIDLYFSFVKAYLRVVHDLRLSSDEIKDYVTFPKQVKEMRIPVTLKQLKQIMNNTSPKRRALYYILVSSGMRIGEALSLRKKDIHLDENPVRISIKGFDTKTRQGRETYISSEAVEKLKPLLENIEEDEKIFTNSDNLKYHVINEDRVFGTLRQRLGYTEKYDNSVRYVLNLHSLRAYFHTKASQKHGVEYAHALDGHSGYMDQYYRLEPKKRADMYKELEDELLVESIKVHSDKTKDKLIESLQDQMTKMEDKIQRIELLNA